MTWEGHLGLSELVEIGLDDANVAENNTSTWSLKLRRRTSATKDLDMALNLFSSALKREQTPTAEAEPDVVIAEGC